MLLLTTSSVTDMLWILFLMRYSHLKALQLNKNKNFVHSLYLMILNRFLFHSHLNICCFWLQTLKKLLKKQFYNLFPPKLEFF